MGRVFVVFLEGKSYSCKHCGTHLALSEDIMSKFLSQCQDLHRTIVCKDKSFHCRHGKAYLFDKVVNVTFGEKEERNMTTGLHIAADIFCVLCGSLVGWNYETAQEKSQKYKEGKSVLERFKICGPDGSRYWVGHDVHSGGSDADDA